jgi:hypothetical protein
MNAKRTGEKTITAQKKMSRIKFLKEETLSTYKRDKLFLFMIDKLENSTRFVREIPDGTNMTQLILPYGFTCHTTKVYSYDLYVPTEQEFIRIVDDAVNNRTSRNIRYEDKTKSYEIHYKKMVELHRQSIKLLYKDTIRSKLMKKVNSDIIRSIVEFL